MLSLQAPAELLLEPNKLGPGSTFSLPAGGVIPETSVNITNGLGQALIKATIGGQKTPLSVVQRLWRLKDGQGGIGNPTCLLSFLYLITVCMLDKMKIPF